MTLKYSVEPSSCSQPYSRTKLFREIFEFGTIGDIHAVWLSAGHLFVTLHEGRQLYTFDCKPVEHIQDSELSGCLDIADDCPVHQVLLKSPHTAIIIFKNGVTQFWSYKTDHVWKQQTTHRLCHGNQTTIVDVCYNVSQNALYWCQREESEMNGKFTYTIYKRVLIEGDPEVKSEIIKLGPASPIIKGCMKCTLYQAEQGVVFVSQPEDSVTGALFIVKVSTTSGQVDILVEQEWITVRDVNVHTLEQFSKIVMKSLQHLNKIKKVPVVKTLYIPQSQTLHLLYSTGKLCSMILSLGSDSKVNIIQLEDFSEDDLVGVCCHEKSIGIVYKHCIRQYNIHTGTQTCCIDISQGVTVLGVAKPLLGAVQQAVYTDLNLLMIHKCVERKNVSEMTLLEMSHFQSDAVRLSYVDKMQKYTARSQGELSLDSLKKKWVENLDAPCTSKLIETVEPFLSQYWKLETVLQEGLKEPNKISQLKPDTVKEEINHILDPKSPLSRQARQSQLVVLAQFSPVEVLDCLLTYLNIPEGEMSTSQQQKWQCALTQETCNVAGSCDIAVPLLEFMCHLLYKHKPEKLVQFVNHGQRVWDHKIGMSAFVRRRQIPFIYERALKCIPRPEHSTDPRTAILSHVHLLLTSQIDGSFTKALHLLLGAEMWDETIELLKEYKDRCPHFSLLYQMTLTAITKKQVLPMYADKIFSQLEVYALQRIYTFQKQVLPIYADKIFSLMPSFKCNSDILQGMSGEASMPILCHTSDEVSVDSVRPYLLGCLQKQDENSVQ